jgi:hypothetical protein
MSSSSSSSFSSSAPSYIDQWVVKWRAADTTTKQNRVLKDMLTENPGFKVPNELEGAYMAGDFMRSYLKQLNSMSAKKGHMASILNERALKQLKTEIHQHPSIGIQVNNEMAQWTSQLKAIPSLKTKTVYERTCDESKSYLVIKPLRYANRCPLDYGRPRIYSLQGKFDFDWYIQQDSRTDYFVCTCDNPKLLKPPSNATHIQQHINYVITKAKKPKKTSSQKRPAKKKRKIGRADDDSDSGADEEY